MLIILASSTIYPCVYCSTTCCLPLNYQMQRRKCQSSAIDKLFQTLSLIILVYNAFPSPKTTDIPSLNDVGRCRILNSVTVFLMLMFSLKSLDPLVRSLFSLINKKTFKNRIKCRKENESKLKCIGSWLFHLLNSGFDGELTFSDRPTANGF